MIILKGKIGSVELQQLSEQKCVESIMQQHLVRILYCKMEDIRRAITNSFRGIRHIHDLG
jgi:hypothetical protein